MKKGILKLSYKSNSVTDDNLYEVLSTDERIVLRNTNQDAVKVHPGENAYTLLDTEDFLVFFDHHLNKRFVLEYCQAEALRALLKINDKEGTKFEFYEKK